MPSEGEELRPSPRLKTLYYIYMMLVLSVFILVVIVPIVITVFLLPLGPFLSVLTIGTTLGILLISAAVAAYWVGAYYRSLRYHLGPEEILVEGGVWWKRRSLVPYSRITNLSVVQGPISRFLGLYTVRIQTAGLPAAGAGVPIAEAEFVGIEDPEALVEKIMGRVRSLRPVAVEAAPEAPADILSEILGELRRIRGLLEGRTSPR